MSTRAQLVADLRNEMKMDFFDKIWALSVKRAAVNKGYFQIQKDANFAWPENVDQTTITLVDGTQEYFFPTRTIRFNYIQLRSNRTELTKTTRQAVLQKDTGEKGVPQEYYFFGEELGVYPTPSAAGTLDILRKKRLADLSDAQDCEFPEDFDEAIVCYGAYVLWKQSKNRDMANSKFQDYKQALSTLKMSYLYQDTNDLSFGYQRRKSRLFIKRAG